MKQAIPMEHSYRYIVAVCLIVVLAVLITGLWNMMRARNPNVSQKLMRWRVGLQFLAIVIMMGLVYLLR
jgi:phosphatidylglycerophosphate synthase